ncbi:Mannan endo-1,4-beta-mannosidase 4, partial [Glycine soja]
SGTHFYLNGKSHYLNGFNSYWLMNIASDPFTSSKVTTTFQEASQHGLNVARTWAFNDGGYNNALQISPGSYNENVFKGLDFIISEAGKNGIRLILSLVNNWNDYGGKSQYVQWARERGQYVNNDDDFFTHPIVKEYYKNHVKDWVREKAAYVKSIDSNHLLEGFYGDSMLKKKQFNFGNQVGTDFISNNQVPEIDFATIHLYPDQWVSNSGETAQDDFVSKWVQAHIQDSNDVLGKPILLTEFKKSSRSSGYNVDKRDSYLGKLYNFIFNSASNGGPCAGGLFWQLMAQEMNGLHDGYEVIFDENPSTANVITQQSKKMSNLE